MNSSDLLGLYESFLEKIHEAAYCQESEDSVSHQRQNNVDEKPPALQYRDERFTDLVGERGRENH